MQKVRLVAAILLALPLIVFGGNYFLELFEIEEQGSRAGLKLLNDMRAGGLMTPIALSHVVIGLFLLLTPTRFAAGLLQLPITIGIVAFHVTMLPEGNLIAVAMLVLNLVVVTDGRRFSALLATDGG